MVDIYKVYIFVKTFVMKFITNILYSDSKKQLTIYFGSGSVFKYEGIERLIYYKLIQSASPQSYYSSNIRGKFNGSKIK